MYLHLTYSISPVDGVHKSVIAKELESEVNCCLAQVKDGCYKYDNGVYYLSDGVRFEMFIPIPTDRSEMTVFHTDDTLYNKFNKFKK